MNHSRSRYVSLINQPASNLNAQPYNQGRSRRSGHGLTTFSATDFFYYSFSLLHWRWTSVRPAHFLDASAASAGRTIFQKPTTALTTSQQCRGGLAILRALGFTLFTGPSLLSLPPSPSFPHLSPVPSAPLPFPLDVGPLNTARGRWERCKLPQPGLGRSPCGNRIWCILALKSDICWHQFY